MRVWISLLRLKLQIWRLLWARSTLTFMQTIECGFTVKLVRDTIITYRLNSLLNAFIFGMNMQQGILSSNFTANKVFKDFFNESKLIRYYYFINNCTVYWNIDFILMKFVFFKFSVIRLYIFDLFLQMK